MMRVNKQIIFVIPIIVLLLTSFSSMVRYFRIHNMTDSTITIECEFVHSGWLNPHTWVGEWYNNANEKCFFKLQSFFGDKRIFSFKILPGEYNGPFSFTPIMFASTSRVDEIPSLTKLKMCFSTLTIKDDKGHILKTLDTMTEDEIVIDEYKNIVLSIY